MMLPAQLPNGKTVMETKHVGRCFQANASSRPQSGAPSGSQPRLLPPHALRGRPCRTAEPREATAHGGLSPSCAA